MRRNYNKAMKKEVDKFRNFLKSKGMRFTPEREIIAEEILASGDHFEAEDLLIRIREKDERISKATIYRTLPLLIQSGLIRKAIFNEKHMHYEKLSNKHHGHMVCKSCGEIIEFKAEKIQELLGDICSKNNFSAEDYKLEITGLCAKCR